MPAKTGVQPKKRIRVQTDVPPSAPFADLLETVPATIITIAPEKRAEAIEALQTVDLVIDKSWHWSASYQPSNRTIKISWRCVEALWCASYATAVLVDKVVPNGSPGQPITLTQDPEVANAMILLRWALDDWYGDKGQIFPAQLIPPRTPRQLGSLASVADELCLCSMAFVLHHELAHHRLDHHHSSHNSTEEAALDALDAERDADADAIHWILEKADATSLFFTKRAAGIVIPLVAMVARGIHTGNFGGTSHPRSFDRLMSWLDNYTEDENHSVWMLIATTLKLHFDNSQLLQAPSGTFETFRDCSQAYVEALASKWQELENLSKPS